MQKDFPQAGHEHWPISTGPFGVLSAFKNGTKNVFGFIRDLNMNYNAGNSSTWSRDGPLIFHMRDGPPSLTGPPGGGEPLIVRGNGPPKKTGPPMEWLVRKKNLNRS